MLFFLDNLQIYQMSVSLQRVFHSIRFRLTKVGVQRYSFFYAHVFHPLLFRNHLFYVAVSFTTISSIYSML